MMTLAAYSAVQSWMVTIRRYDLRMIVVILLLGLSLPKYPLLARDNHRVYPSRITLSKTELAPFERVFTKVADSTSPIIYDHRGRLLVRVKGHHFYDARGRRLGQLRGDSVYASNGQTLGRIQGDTYYNERGQRLGRRQGNRLYDASGKLLGRWDGERFYDARGRSQARFVDMPPETFLVWWWYFSEDPS